MFTFRGIKSLGKSGVRWDELLDKANASQNIDSPEKKLVESTKKEIADLDNVISKNDHLVIARSLEALRKKVESLKLDNEKSKQFIFTQVNRAIKGTDNLDTKSRDQDKLKALKATWEAEYSGAGKEQVTQAAIVQESTKVKLSTLVSSKDYIDSLYEGKTYNRIDINDAMVLVSRIAQKITNNNVDADTKKLFDLIRNPSFSRSGVDNKGVDNKWTGEVGKTLKTELAKFGYNAGADEYADREIADLRDFIAKHLGNDVLKTGKVDPKAKELVDKNFSTLELGGSIVVAPLNGSNLDSLLMAIADMGGTDQGQKSDGVLRGMNSKKYEGWVSRLFTGGEWAQNQIIGELQAYQMLKGRIQSIDQLKNIIVDNLAKDGIEKVSLKEKVSDIFTRNNPEEIKKLLGEYGSVAMNKVVQVRDPRAAVTTMAEHNDMVINQASKMRENMSKIREGVEKNPSLLTAISNKISEIATQNPTIPKKDVESLLSTWKTTFLSNPSLYIGPSVNVTNETVITRIVDQAGKKLSETKAENKNTSVGAFLTLSTTLVGTNGRLSENVGAGAGIGLTGIVGVDGVALQLGASANASLTVKDKNQSLEPLKGNWVLAGSVGVSKELLRDGKVYPSIGVDMNWNSRIDAIKKENFAFMSVLGKLFDDKFQLKDTGITDARTALNELKKRPNNNDAKGEKENFAIRLLEINLAHLESVLATDKVKKDTGKPPLKDVITQQWLSAVTQEYDVTSHKSNSGIELAGAHVGYLFIANILTLGLNFENIQGGYNRASLEQRTKDRKNQAGYNDAMTQEVLSKKKTELLSSRKIVVGIKNEAIEVAKGITVTIDPKSTDIKQDVNPNTGITLLMAAPGKKIDFSVSKDTDNRGLVSTTISVSNIQEKKDVIQPIDDTKEMAEMKLSIADGALLKSLGLSLSKNASREIYAGARNGKMSDLVQAIESYGKTQTYDTEGLIASLTKHSTILGLDMAIVKALTPQNLHKLATILIKFSWGAKGVMSGGRNGDALTFDSKMKKDAPRIFAEERALIKAKDAPPALVVNAQASEQQINTPGLRRTTLSDITKNGGYAGSSMLVVGTPLNHEKNKTGNITSLASDTEGYIYGVKTDVTDTASKEWILNQSRVNTEFQRNKFNTFIQSLNPTIFGTLEMSDKEYAELVSTNTIPKSFQEKLDQIKKQNGLQKLDLNVKQAASFFVGRAGFPGNECFNLTAAVLYPRLSLTIQRKGEAAQEAIAPQDGSLTGEVGSPFTDAQTGTLGFGLSRTERVNTTIIEQAQGPESGESSKPENNTPPTELESSTTVEAESSTTVEAESSTTVEAESSTTAGTEPENNTAPPEGSNTLGGVDE